LAKQLKKKGITKEQKKALADQLKIARKRVKGNIRCVIKARGRIALSENNHREAWRFIRAATFTESKSRDSHKNLQEMNEYFASMVLETNSYPEPSVRLINDSDNMSFEFRPLTFRQVERSISAIKSHTAAGYDELPSFLLKSIASAIAPNMTIIFNASLGSGIFPSVWKKSNICPIWKGKGSKKDPMNFRPISILPILARVFEKLIASQLYLHCESNKIIPVQQFGFRKQSNCELALLSALDSWMKSVDSGAYVGALAIDLSKAFDSVPHRLLLQDLMEIGCSKTAADWFSSYLDNRFQRVCQGSVVTDWKSITKGVPQGSGLSPLLFNIFVRQLPQASLVETFMFADDVTNSAADQDLHSLSSKITEGFVATKAFCESRGLSINASKTQFIVIKSPGKLLPEDYSLTLDGCVVTPVETMKILGVTLDKHLTLRNQIDLQVKKSHGLIGALARATPFLPRTLLKLAYTALIRTHLEYCSAVLTIASKTQLNKLDTIQRIAARVIFQAQRDAHSQPLLDALQLDSLWERRNRHLKDLVRSMLDKRTHPAFIDFFEIENDGSVTVKCDARLQLGSKRFKFMAARAFNESIRFDSTASDITASN